MSSNTAEKIVLYDSGDSPFAQRVWIALEEKKLPYKRKIVSLTEKPKEFTDLYKTINPDPAAAAKVPIIIDTDGTTVTESIIIVEYLDDKYPDSGTTLMPNNAAGRAKVRLFIDTFGNIGVSFMIGFLKADNEEVLKQHVTELEKLLQVLDSFLKLHGSQDGGDYFLGGQYSMADLVLTPFVKLVKVIPLLRKEVDVMALVQKAGLKRLEAWIQALLGRPSAISTGQTVEQKADKLKKVLVPLKGAA